MLVRDWIERKFQFQSGAIKAVTETGVITRDKEFQFQSGAIKASKAVSWID